MYSNRQKIIFQNNIHLKNQKIILVSPNKVMVTLDVSLVILKNNN